MDKKLSLKELFIAYRQWVINNANLVTDVETVTTWSAYFIAGKINKSPIVSELVYALSKLLSLFNDKIIKDAYGNNASHFSLHEQIKLWLTVAHYCEVFIELTVKYKWGTRGKWTVATIIQLFKCSSALILLYRFNDLPIQHPPIPTLQRKKVTEGADSDDNANAFFTLKRSGRVVRRVEGAPPVSLRDWQPIKIEDSTIPPALAIQDLKHAELIHIFKPIVHLAAMRLFGTKSWKQWLIALGLDVASFQLYNKHINDISYEQRLEISRRKLSLILYLLRSPMYNSYSKMVIENFLESTSKKLPAMSFICQPILQYLNHWQDIYFYMWAM